MKNLWKAIVYARRYGFFWAPETLDGWRYRQFLQELDAICLRTLDRHGALSARELADWLNRENLLRTKPEVTGIQTISVATTHDWLSLASRRGLVAPFPTAPADGRGNGASRRHWALTDRGHEKVRSRLLTVLARLPLAPIVTGFGTLIFGGGLLAAIKWLSLHEPVLVAIAIIAGIGLYFGILIYALNRSQKQEGPGMAVVAIETVRSAGEPIPALGAY